MFFFFHLIIFLLLFILFLPILLLLVYFHLISLGFSNLGISSEATLFLLFLMLIGSFFNIPLFKKRKIYREKNFYFFKWQYFEREGIGINLGGAIIPLILSLYFLFLLWRMKFDILPVIIATLLMIIISFKLAVVVPQRGISLPFFIPPLASAILAFFLTPYYPAPTAFIAGTLGTLIGADILNLEKLLKYRGYFSIGGAGIFDGIFLVGIISALLAGIK